MILEKEELWIKVRRKYSKWLELQSWKILIFSFLNLSVQILGEIFACAAESWNECKEWHSILNNKQFKSISAQKTFKNVILLLQLHWTNCGGNKIQLQKNWLQKLLLMSIIKSESICWTTLNYAYTVTFSSCKLLKANNFFHRFSLSAWLLFDLEKNFHTS